MLNSITAYQIFVKDVENECINKIQEVLAIKKI